MAGIDIYEYDEKELVAGAMRNIKNLKKGSYQGYCWALVMETFGCRTYQARALCQKFGINPDELLK